MKKSTASLLIASLTLIPPLASALPRPQRPKARSIKHDIIYRGSPVAANGTSWRSVVRITTNRGSCTGSLIGERSILTAAHCVVGGFNVLGIDFFKGSEQSNYLYFGEGEFIVSQLEYPGEEYTRGERDMAVISVNKRLADRDHWPIQVVNSSIADRIEVGSPIFMIGAGTTGYEKNGGTLRFSQGTISYYTNKMVWVQGNGETGICAGDSGGPLTVAVGGEHYLVGVLAEYRTDVDSKSGDLCTPGGGYSFLSAKKYDWIQGKIAIHDQKLPVQEEPAVIATPTPLPTPTPSPTPAPAPAITPVPLAR